MLGTKFASRMVVCAATTTPANNNQKPAGAPKVSTVSKVRAQVEARLAKLQASREVMEERRRKELWSIAKVLDEIAREEAKRGGEDSGNPTEVTVTFADSSGSSGTDDDDFTWTGPA